ncbi:MAG: Glutamine--fructose-6-phosphate aminotransferase (isomerizing) [Parcubacteria group bacterium ADurb.Bin316]|nr:MAG: Glutamine--fructose-6-phosphate aminotransferase (isomerizing) [Parcubacteria group bacterium ADurb.Bin316]HOZ55970.1 glutamine--fructose-6-phosphate transaminase (isomerizing) [bacterium]
MCGIVGYAGKNEARLVLLEGLKRLEYRGYDSAGIAILGDGIIVKKAVGKIRELESKIDGVNLSGNLGIAHTRWATHGQPSEANAHPHSDCTGKIWVVHNGIIENYQTLKKWLEERGHVFKSETDTEVVPHLLEEFYEGSITKALQRVVKMLQGAYGLAVLHQDEPQKLIAVRYGSPLVIGLGDGETIVASDVSAIIRYTKQVIYLNDGEIAEINSSGLKILDFDFNEINREAQKIEWDVSQAEKNGFSHFMLKEIFEQPKTISDSIRGRLVIKDGKVKLGGLDNVIDKIRSIEKIIIVGCGTARNAGSIGEYMLEEYAGVATEVEYASEFRYRKPVLDNKTAIIAISQSGETADTLAAVKEGKEKNILTLGVVNVVGSTIARTTDAGVYNHIGPEISVASTKAFTSQVAILALITILFGRQRNLSLAVGKRIEEELLILPDKIESITRQSEKIKKIAEKYCHFNNFIYLGRKYNQPVAAEGALKLKEISYIHTEGLPTGEMKHGSISLIDKNFPCLCIAPQDSVYEKNVSNIEEIKARSGKVIAITTEGNDQLNKLVDDVIFIPKTLEMLTPILSVIPLQLFAYHVAALRGCDIDKPRNLAKSVTVE